MPLLISFTAWLLLWPAVTLLKLSDDGESDIRAWTAFPWSLILKFEVVDASATIGEEVPAASDVLEALLAMVTLPSRLPVDCGANWNCKLTLWPASTVPVKFPPMTLNPAPETLTLEIETDAVPVLVNVKACVPVLPTSTLPKSTVPVLADNIPEPGPPCEPAEPAALVVYPAQLERLMAATSVAIIATRARRWEFRG